MWRVGSPVQREIDIPKRPGHPGHAGSNSRISTRLDSSLSLSDVLYKFYSSGWYSGLSDHKEHRKQQPTWPGLDTDPTWDMTIDHGQVSIFRSQITSLKGGWGGHCGNPEAGDEGIHFPITLAPCVSAFWVIPESI